MDELNWEITPIEQRARKGKTLLASFGLVFAFTLFLWFQLSFDFKYCAHSYFECIKENFSASLWIIMIPPIILLALYFINKIYPYSTRKYILSKEFFSISKGSKSKTYRWDEFSAFYIYTLTRVEKIDPSSDFQAQALELEKTTQEVGGTKFLLRTKLRAVGFIKRFVVIYTEPDNSNLIKEFLKAHIPERPSVEIKDSGFTIYEFK